MMKFNVMNRYTGEVQFTAEIDCDEDAGASEELRLAVIWAKENDVDLSCADLRGADLSYVDLRYVDLSCADLRDADLRGADLRGADLHYATLRYATLRYANLKGVDLRGASGYIAGPQRTDGDRFDVRLVNDEWCVVAGRRAGKNWTTDQYRKHAESYADEHKRAETLAILDYLDARIAMEKKQ